MTLSMPGQIVDYVDAVADRLFGWGRRLALLRLHKSIGQCHHGPGDHVVPPCRMHSYIQWPERTRKLSKLLVLGSGKLVAFSRPMDCTRDEGFAVTYVEESLNNFLGCWRVC